MRTTIDIEDDLLAAARDIARAEGLTIGVVVSRLIRRGLTAPSADVLGRGALTDADMMGAGLTGGFGDMAQRPYLADDWPTFPRRDGPPVTSDLIDRISADLDREDAEAFDHARGAPRRFPD
jgi:hypothetical protein